MTKQIVPFGKYKDQPIEVLAADRPYLDWMLAQSWFKDRYPELFTIVINNFQEPADTPEHNAMHMKFLDDNYVFDLLAPIVGFDSGTVLKKRFECDGWDVFVILSNHIQAAIDEISRKEIELNIEYKSCDYCVRREEILCELDKLWSGIKTAGIYVELKPTISDDFPAVMRQMKSMKRVQAKECDMRFCVLVVGTYTGIGATREQFVQFMANEGIHVIFAE